MKKRRKAPKKTLVEDFTKLKVGDIVTLIGGHGDHYKGENGEKQYFADRGRYKVVKVDRYGIVVYGEHGYEYLNMKKRGKSKLLQNYILEPHKLYTTYCM
jgi:hypothetical protein